MNKTFKRLVDSAFSSLRSNSSLNLNDLYDHYELDYENSLTLDKIFKHLYKTIQNSLSGSCIRISEIFTLKEDLILAHLVKKEQLQPYLVILEIIIDAVSENNNRFLVNQLVSFNAEDKWHVALQAALDVITIKQKPIKYQSKDLEELYPRQFAVSQSATFFQTEGFHVEVQDGKLMIEECQARQMANRLEADIKLLGGIEVLRRIFQLIGPEFNIQQERYHLVRKFNNPNYPSISFNSSIPFNYLLNLCVKYPRRSMPIFVDNFENVWMRICKRSIALASVLDVEPYSQFTLLFHNPDTIAQFLQELAMYDNLFCPTQLRPSDVSKMLEGLFSPYSERIYQILGWKPQQAAMVAEKILNLTKNKMYPITFQSQDLNIPDTQIRRSEIDKLLSIYSHSSSYLNFDFKIPQDIATLKPESYFYNKPLIRTSDNRYLLIAPSICAPAFYEALVSEIREKVDSRINDKLGIEVENFIKSEFLNRKIKVISGKYGNTKGQTSTNEIDLLIETSKALIFFEVKAKALTRLSRCGAGLNLFLDLFKSLLDSQFQINKHEIFIRRNKSILMEDGTVCHLNNREIARVSVTLLDFGSFQDRTIIFQFLENMLRGELDISNVVDQSKIEQINKMNCKLERFRDQFKELCSLAPQTTGKPFYNCWFLSLPQLLIILDHVKTADDLQQEIWKTRNFSASSLDFYMEYDLARHSYSKV